MVRVSRIRCCRPRGPGCLDALDHRRRPRARRPDARGGRGHGPVSVDRCLGTLDEAIAAAKELGLDASAAVSTRDTARARLGFPSSAYVLALAGGTGVGKSTLLNAIAGENVSVASARRPTTSNAVAWVSSTRGRELAGLLQWLGVSELREHAGGALADVAVIDLPDFDSIAHEHRERVDALLPRVHAVAWIVDPETYLDR